MIKATRLILLLLIALATSPFAARAQVPTAEDEEKLVEVLTEARSRYIEKDHQGSIELFRQYMDLLPPKTDSTADIERVRAHYNIAANQIALGELDGAYQSLEQAIDFGLWSRRRLENDPTFEALRGTQSFRLLLEKADRALAGMAFGLSDLDGKRLAEKDFEGKVLIVDVWGTWCPPCRMEIPHFVELQEKYRDQGLRVIGVTYERRPPSKALRQHVRNAAKRLDINYPCVLATRDMYQSAGVRSFPTTFFIDRNGRVRDKTVGYRSYDDLEKRIAPLLREKKKPAPGRQAKKLPEGGDAAGS